jgi:hypothetical protein
MRGLGLEGAGTDSAAFDTRNFRAIFSGRD